VGESSRPPFLHPLRIDRRRTLRENSLGFNLTSPFRMGRRSDLGLAIFAIAYLTYFGKVFGDALLFLVGIVVGYLLNTIQGLLYSPWKTDSDDRWGSLKTSIKSRFIAILNI